MGLLEGKNAIITGSARGIGRATAELFAANGANVLINDLDADAAEQASSEIDGATAVFAGDLTEADAADRMVETAMESFGSIDIVVPLRVAMWHDPQPRRGSKTRSAAASTRWRRVWVCA